MNPIFLDIVPFLISTFLGYLVLRLTFRQQPSYSTSFYLFLAVGVGLGFSSMVTFLGFLLFHHLEKTFIFTVHILTFLTLYWIYMKKDFQSFTRPCSREEFILLAVLSLCLVPAWIIANFYPFGGWDAWQVWNLKAKFLFLGGDHWINIFQPSLWRSSPHYPLFLPLVNVWGWLFVNDNSFYVPMLASIVFTFACAGLIFSACYLESKSRMSILPALLFLTVPFALKLAVSQYADLIFGYYLLASLTCLKNAKTDKTTRWLIIAACMMGCLSFIKPEGLVATMIIAGISLPYLFWGLPKEENWARGLFYATALAVCLIPAGIFYGFYAPKNITFINGFQSSTHPSDILRMQVIGAFYFFESFSTKWNGTWVLLLLGLGLSFRKAFNRTNFIFPLFIFLYLLAVSGYYLLNTYFQIVWWLQVSFHRISFSLLPTILYWIFVSLFGSYKTAAKPKNI